MSSSTSPALTETNLPGLTLISKGKVRDIYSTSDPNAILFVATDRSSIYDVMLNNSIPRKGAFLTTIALFWFNKLSDVFPNHLITASINDMPPEIHPYASQIEGRVMLVRKAKVIPIEAIVRGYLSGSAWDEYKKSGTANGIPLPPGLVESSKLPEPLLTPSTKAEAGVHDENITPKEAAEIVGEDLYARIANAALRLYTEGAAYAESRGLILADTKFEFGLIPSSTPDSPEQLVLIDEALTPDSSRYWPLASYKPGGPQPSFDKQYLRDWLVERGFKRGMESGPAGKEGCGWSVDESVVEGTVERYKEVVRLLVGDSA